MNEGFTLINVCEDYDEDKKEHIVTWAHIFGLKKTLLIAFIFSFFGVLCIIALFMNLIYYKTGLIFVLGLFSIIFSLDLIIYSSYDVFKITKKDDLKVSIKIKDVNLQKWFIITRYPLMISALILLL